jgi:signal transduction histidine kinase
MPHALPPKAAPDVRPRSSATIPWLVFAAGLLVAVATRHALADRIERLVDERFTALAAQVRLSLENHIRDHLQLLRGAQGLWHSGAPVNREAWRRYTEALRLEENYPGLEGLGFAAAIAPGDLGGFEQRVRSEAPLAPPALRERFTGFAVHPAEGAHELRTPILYLAPFAGRNLRAFGFDPYSEPVRRAAMARARDSGEAALSARVRLAQEDGANVQPGFVVYLPVYRAAPRTPAQRQAQLQGFVFAAFRAHDLMRNTLGSPGEYVQFAVYDGGDAGPAELLYRSEEPGGASAHPGITLPLTIAGHRWTMVARRGPGLIATPAARLPDVVAIALVLISALISVLSFAYLRTNERGGSPTSHTPNKPQGREQRLAELSDQLARSNDDLQDFAYAASHDLKEPLRSIAGSLSVLERRYGEGLDARGREFLGYARDGAQRLASLIDSLLEYSRVETQGTPLAPVDLERVADTVLSDLGRLIEETHARIERTPLPQVLADRGQVARLLQNLLINAIKYSRGRPQDPRVSLGARREGARWVISVGDNGIGIPPEHHERIFGMFRRLHTREEYEGQGMGLALCRRIVQRHGGQVWVESRPGQGSTFHFTLPAAGTGSGAAPERNAA